MGKYIGFYFASVIIFIVDIATPLEVSIFALYILIVCLAAWSLPKPHSIYVLFLNLGLIAVAFFHDPSGLTYFIGLLNRIIITGISVALYFVISNFRLANSNLNIANEKLNKAVAEKEFLIRETHHRTKNNLQIIQSILNVQAREIDNPRVSRFASQSIERINSIMLLHDQLFRLDSDFKDKLNARSYLNEIVDTLITGFRNSKLTVSYKTEIADLDLNSDNALSLGLILNELITNSLKYAFPNRDEGVVEVKLLRYSESLIFTYSDNGVGFPDVESGLTNKGLGFVLIEAFSKQIGGEFKYYNKNGLTFELIFEQNLNL